MKKAMIVAGPLLFLILNVACGNKYIEEEEKEEASREEIKVDKDVLRGDEIELND